MLAHTILAAIFLSAGDKASGALRDVRQGGDTTVAPICGQLLGVSGKPSHPASPCSPPRGSVRAPGPALESQSGPEYERRQPPLRELAALRGALGGPPGPRDALQKPRGSGGGLAPPNSSSEGLHVASKAFRKGHHQIPIALGQPGTAHPQMTAGKCTGPRLPAAPPTSRRPASRSPFHSPPHPRHHPRRSGWQVAFCGGH